MSMIGRHHHHHHRRSNHDASASNSQMDRGNRRRQFRVAMLILPGVLFVIGLAVWYWGMNYNRAIQDPDDDLVQCGLWLMGVCGGIFMLLLLIEWISRIVTAVKDTQSQRDGEHVHHHRHRHHHHRSGEGDADGNAPDSDTASER